MDAGRRSIDIRRLGAGDAAAHRALMLAAYRLHGDAFTATVEERGPLPLDWWKSRIESEFVVGAWQGERLVGAAGLAREPRPKTRHKATLFGMYVEAAFTGRGIGERLVAAILDHAGTQDGLRIVQLTVSETNRSARALYERCGFAAFGVEPFAITSEAGYLAKVHLWLDLAARAAGG